MIVDSKKDLPVRIVIFLLFVVLLIGSVYYYQERMLFCDAAHIFFEIANTSKLQIQENRFGSFITQLFPLIATKAHIPLKEALILYSISFNLFYLAIVALILFKFKNTKLGILFALYLVLFVSDTYFWTNNEIHQAMGWCFLLFGIIQNYNYQRKHKAIHFTVVILLATLCLFTHPLTLFIFPFLWLFTILEKDLNSYNKKQIIFLSIAFVAVLGLKYYTMKHGGYDTNKVHNVTHISFSDLWNAFKSPLSKLLIDKLIKDYFFIPILFFIGLIAAMLKKKYKQIALVLFFTFLYFLAICLTYVDFAAFYTESELMPFSIITSTLFVYYVTPSINTKLVALSLLIIFAVRLNFIMLSAKKFEVRKQWIFSTIKNMKQQGIYKGYIYNNDTLQQKLLIIWGGPVEGMIASALIGEKPNRTFVVDSKEEIQRRMVHKKNEMIGCFRPYKFEELNEYYFVIDTVLQYQDVK